jgi:hypothetical protein
MVLLACWLAGKKFVGGGANSLGRVRLKERLDGLLREAAEVQLELSRADGSIQGIPHYSVIEGQAHELGRQLSREVQPRLFGRARLTLEKIGDAEVSTNTIQRVVGDVGNELASVATRPRRRPMPWGWSSATAGGSGLAKPGHGPGVHLSGEGWRETKQACLIKATRTTFDEDPQPEPPDCFCHPAHVAEIAETEALSVAAPATALPAGDQTLAGGCEGFLGGRPAVELGDLAGAVSRLHAGAGFHSSAGHDNYLPRGVERR